jgi:hypothetical protein
VPDGSLHARLLRNGLVCHVMLATFHEHGAIASEEVRPAATGWISCLFSWQFF